MSDCAAVCAEDVYDAVLRAGARLNLPILPLAERLAGQKWDLPSPPPKASPWVDELCMHLQMFREKLRQIKSLSDGNLRQVAAVSQLPALKLLLVETMCVCGWVCVCARMPAGLAAHHQAAFAALLLLYHQYSSIILLHNTACSHLKSFCNLWDRQDFYSGRDKVAAKLNSTARQAVRMSCADGVLCTPQLWRHAIHYTAEVVLEGIAKVKTRCSAIGRNAMSSGKSRKCSVLDQRHSPWKCSLAALHKAFLLVTNCLRKEMAKFQLA